VLLRERRRDSLCGAHCCPCSRCGVDTAASSPHLTLPPSLAPRSCPTRPASSRLSRPVPLPRSPCSPQPHPLSPHACCISTGHSAAAQSSLFLDVELDAGQIAAVVRKVTTEAVRSVSKRCSHARAYPAPGGGSASPLRRAGARLALDPAPTLTLLRHAAPAAAESVPRGATCSAEA
jgi:hypothetical protein